MQPLRLTLRCFPLLAAACLTACGTASPNTPVTTTTATPTTTAPVTATATTTVTATAPEPAATATVTVGATEKTGAPRAAAVRKRLPNVVGMNLQAGQDALQAAGFYVLDDQDATGQGRLQVYDRNWVVTKQSPAAGRTVSVDTLITLYAKKIGE